MSASGLRLGRLAGIPVLLHPLWFAVVALMTAVLGADYYPSAVPGIVPAAAYALALATVLGLFASVLAHELGHALVARRDGVEIERIDLWPLGGIARMRELPRTAGAELRMALAGPAVSVALCAVLAGAALAVPAQGARALHEALAYLGLLNGILAVFNLVPALPLDGGRVAHAIVWMRRGDRDSATIAAAAAGRAFGWLFVAVGLGSWIAGAPPGPWFAVIGAFVLVVAAAEARAAVLHQVFGGRPARTLMTPRPATVPETATMQEVAERLAAVRHVALPVVDADLRVIGLITAADVAAVPVADRNRMLAAAAAHRDPALIVTADADVGELLERPAFAEVGRAVVVDRRRRARGIVSITDVERALQGRSLVGPPGARAA